MPFVSILNVVFILGSGKYEWMSLAAATTLTKATLTFFVLAYMIYYFHAVWRDLNYEVKSVDEVVNAAAEKSELVSMLTPGRSARSQTTPGRSARSQTKG